MTRIYYYLMFIFLFISICHAEEDVSLESLEIDNVCQLPIDEGDCGNDLVHSSEEVNSTVVFGYNNNSTKCVEFIYEGCYGNRNRFETKNECWKMCYTPLNYFLARVSELITNKHYN